MIVFIAESLYFSWSKEFLEAGKRRLSGDTARQATSPEVKDLRSESLALKECVADLTLENRLLKKSMTGAGEFENLSIIETPYDIEGGGKAFEKLMAADLKPTVIMCGNDVLATGVISKAREMGLSVPHDVSVTGFDDIELARCVWPPLTTVHVPHRQMGREAANALIDLIEKRSTNISRELDVSIVMRGSLVGL